jgi:hypothetical protein
MSTQVIAETGVYVVTGQSAILRPIITERMISGTFSVTAGGALRFIKLSRLASQAQTFQVTSGNAALGSIRQVNVSLRFAKPTTSATLKFLPDLSAGDELVILEKDYTLELTSPGPSTELSGFIMLPTKHVGSIPYRVQFPKETGFNEHYIYLDGGSEPVELATLLTLSTMTAGTVDLTDLNDVFVENAVTGEYLRYNGVKWTNAVIPVEDLPNDVMLKSVYDADEDGIVEESRRTVIQVFNATGSTLTKGTVVKISGMQGDRPRVSKAAAVGYDETTRPIGLVNDDIPNMEEGRVVTEGTIYGNDDSSLNTTAFTVGDSLWLDPDTDGGVINTQPVQPDHSVFIGYVARSHPNAGQIIIAIDEGEHLEWLHDVLLTNPTSENLLAYNATSALWENKTKSNLDIASDSTVVKLTGNQTVAGNKTFTGVLSAPNAVGVFNPTTGEIFSDFLGNATPIFVGLNTLVLTSSLNIAAPVFTAQDGQKLLLRINTDLSTASITWDPIYREGSVKLPLAVKASETLYVGFLYNQTVWDLVGYVQV